ncbi:hypothetical protein BJX96DRAFT_24841 [Aspergillus floccosus]
MRGWLERETSWSFLFGYPACWHEVVSGAQGYRDTGHSLHLVAYLFPTLISPWVSLRAIFLIFFRCICLAHYPVFDRPPVPPVSIRCVLFRHFRLPSIHLRLSAPRGWRIRPSTASKFVAIFNSLAYVIRSVQKALDGSFKTL